MEKKQHTSIEDIVLLNRIFTGGSKAAAGFLLQGMTTQEMLDRIERENWLGKGATLSETRKIFEADREIAACQEMKIRFLPLTSPEYPNMLRHISDPPLLLYMKGSLELRDANSFAIVGSRNATFYGISQARKFASELAASGFTIVSGLALGIDRAAHEGALQTSGGRTVAVLGCGIDRIYPLKNRDLYERIPDKGVILSEYALGAQPLAHHFPSRNRIISGLSLGTLVVEAHTRSGSLITASKALEQGREVFALPGRADQLTSRGAHALIKQGAILADSAEDVLQTIVSGFSLSEEFQPNVGAEPIACGSESLNDMESDDLIRKALLEGSETFEEVLAVTGLNPGRLLSELVMREIKGEIRKNQQGKYSLNPT